MNQVLHVAVKVCGVWIWFRGMSEDAVNKFIRITSEPCKCGDHPVPIYGVEAYKFRNPAGYFIHYCDSHVTRRLDETRPSSVSADKGNP